mmetsp:Transcript_15013/g.23364  ORF Transcript_15013/g.23364 Transcript_15013/m.23364 type:complete len:98 (+) Transcript_15013:1239-1532(+)
MLSLSNTVTESHRLPNFNLRTCVIDCHSTTQFPEFQNFPRPQSQATEESDLLRSVVSTWSDDGSAFGVEGSLTPVSTGLGSGPGNLEFPGISWTEVT